MSIRDYIVIGILMIAIVLAINVIVKQRKMGKCMGCGGNCASCNKSVNMKRDVNEIRKHK